METRECFCDSREGCRRPEAGICPSDFRGTIREGDRVRSYDFEGRRDCYIEGVVTCFESVDGCERYAIHVERIVFSGVDITADRAGFYAGGIFPPVNGTPKLFGGVCNGVERIA